MQSNIFKALIFFFCLLYLSSCLKNGETSTRPAWETHLEWALMDVHSIDGEDSSLIDKNLETLAEKNIYRAIVFKLPFQKKKCLFVKKKEKYFEIFITHSLPLKKDCFQYQRFIFEKSFDEELLKMNILSHSLYLIFKKGKSKIDLLSWRGNTFVSSDENSLFVDPKIFQKQIQDYRDARFDKNTQIYCHKVDAKCADLYANQCDQCPFGFVEIVDYNCPQGSSKICRPLECGTKGNPACRVGRGDDLLKRNLCYENSPYGFCQEGLSLFCDSDNILICL